MLFKRSMMLVSEASLSSLPSFDCVEVTTAPPRPLRLLLLPRSSSAGATTVERGEGGLKVLPPFLFPSMCFAREGRMMLSVLTKVGRRGREEEEDAFRVSEERGKRSGTGEGKL